MWQNLRNVWMVQLSLPVGEAPIAVSRMGTEILLSNCYRTYHNKFSLQTLTHKRIRRWMRVTLRISLGLSTLMFSLLNAHGNVCWITFEVLIEGPFVSIWMLRIISCEPNNHVRYHKLENLWDYSKNYIRHNTNCNWQMILDNVYFNTQPAPFLVLERDDFVHFRKTFGYGRVERLKSENGGSSGYFNDMYFESLWNH